MEMLASSCSHKFIEMKCEILVIEALGCEIYTANESCLIVARVLIALKYVAEGFSEVIIAHTPRGPE